MPARSLSRTIYIQHQRHVAKEAQGKTLEEAQYAQLKQSHAGKSPTHTREHPTVNKLFQPRQNYCLFPTEAAVPRLVQLAKGFGATIGPVFPLKRSSDWVFRSPLWMGQAKLGRVSNTRKQHHTPPRVRMNHKPRVGWYLYIYMPHVVRTGTQLAYS